jgi:peptidoglycan/LPS O-acetylase OafA/YrhL
MIARSESHGVLTVEDPPPPAYESTNGSAAPGSGLGGSGMKDSLTRMSAGKLFSALLAALTPEIFQRKRGASAHRALRPGTAWLDGLRGWAAFIVCFVHLTVYTHPDLELCYGHPIPFKQDVFNYSPAAWPFARVLWSGGHFSVAIFFVISGYVLTQKLTATLHENRRDDFIQSVNSAVFRRAIRLYMPVILSTFQLIFVWHVLGIQTPWPPRQPNLFREIIHWFNETMMFGFFFKTGFLFTIYNIHTWTIPVELRGSLFVWLWLFAFHQVENRIRIISTAVFLFYQVFFTPGAWYACFFAGMMTAETHNLWSKGSPPFKLPWDGIIRALRARPFFLAVLMHLMFVASLYLAGEPGADMYAEELLYNCPGWGTLGRLIPVAYYDREHASVQRWFWLFWAAWFLVISGREIGWVKRFFETDFSQCECSLLLSKQA